jgi:hypothetical protein
MAMFYRQREMIKSVYGSDDKSAYGLFYDSVDEQWVTELGRKWNDLTFKPPAVN